MKKTAKFLSIMLTMCLIVSLVSVPAFAASFTDAHGDVIELDDALEAYSTVTLYGAGHAARMGETNLGDLWTDALRWFAVSGKIIEYYDEDDIAAGNSAISVDDDHVVALWNGGNIRDDISAGIFGAEEIAKVLPYPNKVAVVYMTGEQLLEALEAASQGLPYTTEKSSVCASFMQVAGLKYTVDISEKYDAGEAYGTSWFMADSINRTTITEVNGQAFDPDATYAVITNNANYNGMDSSYVFKEAVEANENSTITTVDVRDVVWMYISEELENVVGEEYAEAQGRILVVGMAFTDVEKDSYYESAVKWAVEAGVTQGSSETTFSPDVICSRAQVVTFLWRAAGSPATVSAENQFDDVEEGAYYYDAVLWAVENGITAGISDSTFSPDEAVTRAQVVTFLYRAANAPEVTGEAPFEDISVGAYYEDAVAWAVENGIANGVSETSFAPETECSRAQVVTFMSRYFQ